MQSSYLSPSNIWGLRHSLCFRFVRPLVRACVLGWEHSPAGLPSTSSYSAPTEERSIVTSVSVCLSVCVCVRLTVHDHIFGTTHPIFTKLFDHVTYGRGSVLLWRRSDMLCTSGFMDDVIFAHKPRLLDVAAQLDRSAHAALGLDIHRVTVT